LVRRFGKRVSIKRQEISKANADLGMWAALPNDFNCTGLKTRYYDPDHRAGAWADGGNHDDAGEAQVGACATGSVAGGGAGVGEGFAGFGEELPVVGVRMESEFEDAEGGGVADLGVGLGGAEGTMVFAAGADDEFADAAGGVGEALGILRSKALVVVIVTVENDVGMGRVETIPERLDFKIVAVRAAGTEERLVPVGESAGGGMRGEIGTKPFFLRRTGAAAANVGAFTVEDDDVPGCEIVAVVAGFGVARSGTEVIKVGSGTGRMKFVIAGSGAGTGLGAAPGLVVAAEIFGSAVGIGEVTGSEDCAGDLVEELGGGFGTGRVFAVGDIAGADEDGGLGVRLLGARGKRQGRECEKEESRCDEESLRACA